MGSRFGAAVPRKKNTGIKVILGGITASLVCVLFFLVWSIQNKTEVEASLNHIPEPIKDKSGNIGVLVPMFRIEAGEKISEDMFKVSFLDENQVPMGAVLNHNRGMLSDKYAAKLISPNTALVNDDIAISPPISSIEIPVGYRLITILVDNQSGVDGFARPGTRVDVNWTFMKDGKKKLASPLVRFVKVASLGGDSEANSKDPRVQIAADKKITVSLLVTERQSQFIEVAKGNGQLSLALVGGSEAPIDLDQAPKIIDVNDIIKTENTAVEPEEEESGNVLYTTDRVTGKQVKFVLKNGRKWIRDEKPQE